MKTSVYLKALKDDGKSGLSNVCFRVRDREIDIKITSELCVMEKYWDEETLRYRKNNVVDKKEQKRVPEQIAAVIEHIEATFDRNTANGTWLRQTIEDVLHPQRAYEREHPSLLRRMDEYIEQHGGTKNTKAQIVGLQRKITRYIAYNREILGDTDFNLFVETITVEDMNDFRDYMVSEHSLYNEQPAFYSQYIKEQYKPKEMSNTTVINNMNLLCVFLHWCKKMGYTKNESFLQYGCKVPVYGDPFYLTSEERNALYDADLSDEPSLAVIRDIFVFHCYVGCRVGDLYRLTRDNIKGGFLEYMPQKTKKCEAKTVRVPLHEKALAILKRYKNSASGKLLPFKRIYIYNKPIGEVNQHDLLYFNSFVDSIVSDLNFEKVDFTINGRECTKFRIEEVINEIQPTADDIVIFCYFGYGGRSAEDISEFPQMILNSHDESDSVPLEDVKNAFVNKGAGFVFVIGNCGNYVQNQIAHKKDVLKVIVDKQGERCLNTNKGNGLFAAKGSVTISASSKGEFAFTTFTGSEARSLFMTVLLHELQHHSAESTWEDILQTTRKEVAEYFQKHIRPSIDWADSQTPAYAIDIH